MQDFRRLRVWTKSHALTLWVYAATSEFPRCEIYGLTVQLRRSASSVSATLQRAVADREGQIATGSTRSRSARQPNSNTTCSLRKTLAT